MLDVHFQLKRRQPDHSTDIYSTKVTNWQKSQGEMDSAAAEIVTSRNPHSVLCPYLLMPGYVR